MNNILKISAKQRKDNLLCFLSGFFIIFSAPASMSQTNAWICSFQQGSGYRFEKDRWTSIKYDMSDFPPYVIRPRRNGEDPQVNQDLTHVTSQTGSGFNSYCRDDVMRLGRSSTPSSVVLNCRLPLGNLYFDEKTLRAVISNYDIYEPYTAVGRCTNF